jgi:nuclease S1
MPPRSRLSVALRTLAVALLLGPIQAWGWGSDGHKIVARIAADNLSPSAQSQVAGILGVPTSQLPSAMEAASILPDTRFREEDHCTEPWHFIDICLSDTRADIPRRCRGGNCVTARIDEYSRRLTNENYDRWGAVGDLAFLIHFVGDLHQPLHAADDADKGGNCIMVDYPRAENLHNAWDDAVVRGLERSLDSGRPDPTARRLEETYASEQALDRWVPGDSEAIAWESNQIARTEIYGPLNVPIEPCGTRLLCRTKLRVDLSPAYMEQAEVIAGHQLAKAGFRLASLLNEIWTQPVSHDLEPSVPAPGISSQTISGQIVGNQRSKIYAWPGCGSYDRMAPANRVVFPSVEAAQQAGYRAARNCP